MSRSDPDAARAAPPLDTLLAALLARSPEALVLTDSRQMIVAVNGRLVALTGLEPEALHGQPLARLLDGAADGGVPSDGRAIDCAFVGPGGAGWRGRLRHLADGADGTRLYAAEPLHDDTPTRAALAMAVNAAKVGVYRYDLLEQRVYYNDHGWAQMRAAPRVEGIAVAELDAVHPDDVAAVRAAGVRAIATGKPVDVQARYLLPDGEVRHFLSRRVAQFDDGGQPNALIGVVLDNTEQVEQTARTLELARRLDSLCAALGIGVWSQDAAGHRSRWNVQMWALFGLAPREHTPSFEDFLRDCVYPEDRALLRERSLSWARSAAPVIETEYRIVRPDGRLRRIAVSARRERTGGSAGMRAPVFGIARDVTEQHDIGTALRDASERVALVAHAVGLGTWRLDLTSGRREWDDNMFRLRGLAPQPAPPERRMQAVHPDDAARLRAMHDEVARTGEPRSYEFRVVWPDGSVRTLGARVTPLADATGQVSSLLGVNWDITEARAAQQALLQRDAAERENRAKSQFLARMSHELRTPLNAVLGFTQLLAADVRDPHHRTQLGHVRSAGEHLLSLINDALDLARLQSDELALSPETVPLDALVAEAVALVQPLARDGGVTLRVDAVSGSARADRLRLRQVLINLLSNAVKYNHRGGHAAVHARAGGGRVRLVVRDSGRGMSAQQLERLFEPFNRLGAEGSGVEGTGIGLAIARGLVERMGGSIAVCSTAGQGSEFTLELPAADGTAAPRVDVAAAPGPAQRLAHVGRLLYIEDNPVNAMLVSEMVKQHTAFTLDTAADGASGVARARAVPPDLVLVDMQLPDFDGYEVLRRLRADPATAKLPCIALSANALADDIKRATAAGFAEYWTKPIDLQRFLQALDAFFGAPRGG